MKLNINVLEELEQLRGEGLAPDEVYMNLVDLVMKDLVNVFTNALVASGAVMCVQEPPTEADMEALRKAVAMNLAVGFMHVGAKTAASHDADVTLDHLEDLACEVSDDYPEDDAVPSKPAPNYGAN